MKQVEIQDKTFNNSVMIFLNCTHKELNQYLKKIGFSTVKELESASGLFFLSERKADKVKACGIVIFKYDHDIKSQGILVHEICHLVRYITFKKGMDNKDHTNDEVFAYLTEFFYTQAIEKINNEEYTE